MDIYRLLGNFWALNREMAVSPNAAYLYYWLINESNAQRWLNPIPVATKTIELELEMTRKAIAAARRELADRGLIEYSDGGKGKGKPSLYRIKVPKNAIQTGRKSKPKTTSECPGMPFFMFPTETYFHQNMFPNMFPTETYSDKNMFPNMFLWETLPPYIYNTNVLLKTYKTIPPNPPGGISAASAASSDDGFYQKKDEPKTESAPLPEPHTKTQPKPPLPTKPPSPLDCFEQSIAEMKGGGAAREAMAKMLSLDFPDLDNWIDRFRDEMVATGNIEFRNVRQYFVGWCRKRLEPAQQTSQSPTHGTNTYRRDPNAEFAERKRREAEHVARILAKKNEPEGDLPY